MLDPLNNHYCRRKRISDTKSTNWARNLLGWESAQELYAIWNTKCFQMVATKKKGKTPLGIKDEYGNRFADQDELCRSLLLNFVGDRKDLEVNINMAIPLSSDILEDDNIFLPRSYRWRNLSNSDQINSLKALGPDGLHAVFYQKRWYIIGTNISIMVKSS